MSMTSETTVKTSSSRPSKIQLVIAVAVIYWLVTVGRYEKQDKIVHKLKKGECLKTNDCPMGHVCLKNNLCAKICRKDSECLHNVNATKCSSFEEPFTGAMVKGVCSKP